MMKEINELRNAAKDNANSNGNKNEVNKLKKALKEAEDKIEKVTLEKVRVEAESNMTARMNTNLETMLAMYQGGGVRAAVSPASPGLAPAPSLGPGQHKDRDMPRKCYKFEKGQCNVANCKFLHPDVVCQDFARNGMCRERNCQKLHKGDHKGDCHFWKGGDCRYSEADCGKGKHRENMFNFYNLQGGQVQQHGGQVAPPAPAVSARSAPSPSASFFGGGQGGAAPPPGAMSREAMVSMIGFLSAQLSARGPGQ